jgi:ActR/RegA family two-component response regulator
MGFQRTGAGDNSGYFDRGPVGPAQKALFSSVGGPAPADDRLAAQNTLPKGYRPYPGQPKLQLSNGLAGDPQGGRRRAARKRHNMIHHVPAKRPSSVVPIGSKRLVRALPILQPRAAKATSPTGLAISSSTAMLQALAEALLHSGITTFLAESVQEALRVRARQEVQLILCDDRLVDGQYEDVLRSVQSVSAPPAVIVVSPTGEWADYLDALNAGAFDYLPFPPIAGGLPRAIRYALASLASPGGPASRDICGSSIGEIP